MKGANLLFVFADQMRGMDMGCAGNPDVRTPHFDALARTGRRFEQCFANSPVCGPNRATMLTGLLAPHAGVPVNDLPLKDGVETLGTIAKRNGWQTGYIGKWHLDGLPREKFTPPGPRRFGFDYWAAFNCFHDYFTPRYFRDTPEMIRGQGYEPAVQTDLAIDFLSGVDRDRPFALVLSWGPPHDPYFQVPRHCRDLYDPANLELRPNVRADLPNPLSEGRDCREVLADYYAAITALDEQFGRLMEALARLKMEDDTLVIFTSDHGDMLWSQGFLKKQLPYQESVNVPMLARHPALSAGSVSRSLFGSIDLLPALCGLLGWRHEAAFEGEDLSAAFLGQAARREPLLLGNYISSDEAVRQGIGEWRGIHTGLTMYAELAPGRPWLFFDNASDPFQLRNLAEDASARPAMLESRRILHEMMAASGDGFSEPAEMIRELGVEKEWEQAQGPKYSPEIGAELLQTTVYREAREKAFTGKKTG